MSDFATKVFTKGPYVVSVALAIVVICFFCSLFLPEAVVDFIANMLLIAGGVGLVCFSKLLDKILGD